MIRRLLDASADANTVDAAGDTLLMTAVRTGSLDAVLLLIDRGADVNAADPDLAHTALMWAVRSNNAAIMRLC